MYVVLLQIRIFYLLIHPIGDVQIQLQHIFRIDVDVADRAFVVVRKQTKDLRIEHGRMLAQSGSGCSQKKKRFQSKMSETKKMKQKNETYI